MKSQTKSIAENLKMNLIEKLGLEKCKAIVEGAPAIANNTQRYKSIGNGWTIDVIAHILGRRL